MFTTKKATGTLKTFIEDKKGSVMMSTALTILPVMFTIGIAVDYSQAYKIQDRIQSSSDAALVSAVKQFSQNSAAYKTPDQIKKALKDEFTPLFEQNMVAGGYSPDFGTPTIDYNPDNQKATVTIESKIPTSFMQIAGYKEFDLKSITEVTLSAVPENYVIDITMCIDATGSMQSTINSVRENAKTFDKQLRAQLGVSEDNEYIKIRVRPIYYRDQLDQYLWERVHNLDLGPHGGSGSVGVGSAAEKLWGPDVSKITKWGKKLRKDMVSIFGRTTMKPYKNRDLKKINNMAQLNQYAEGFLESGPTKWDDVPSSWESTYNSYGNHWYYKDKIRPGIVSVDDFYDLSGEKSAANSTAFKNFLDSENAFAGWDWPEAGAACTHEAMQSPWYDKTDEDNKDDFPEPKNGQDKIVTVFPIIVTWTDASVHSDMERQMEWLSYDMPTNWTDMEKIWDAIDPNPEFSTGPKEERRPSPKLYVLFTSNSNLSQYGWRDIKTWDGFAYGGSLSTGNEDAIKVIADKIKQQVDVKLHISS